MVAPWVPPASVKFDHVLALEPVVSANVEGLLALPEDDPGEDPVGALGAVGAGDVEEPLTSCGCRNSSTELAGIHPESV